MKDFEEFRVEAFNNILPLVKEVVDVWIKDRNSLVPARDKYNKDIEELKVEKKVLKKIGTIKEKISEVTYNEIKQMKEEVEKQIEDKEALNKKIQEEISVNCDFVFEYRKYIRCAAVSFFINPKGAILKKAEEVKIEYLREYFYLMFILGPVETDLDRMPSVSDKSYSRENLLSEEVIEYICKYLIENEKEDVANKKIAVLRGEKVLQEEEFIELFK